MRVRWIVAALCLAPPALGCGVLSGGKEANPPPRPRPRRHDHGTSKTAPEPPPGDAMPTDLVTDPELPPQPPRNEPPSTPTVPTNLAPGAAVGRPSGFTPDATPAYWIWQGPRGGWRIRTTTKGALHTFRGRITPIRSAIETVSPSRTELSDRVWKSDQTWFFTFTTAGHADGLTFHTEDNDCVKFDLQLDGGPVPKRIVVGKNQVSPTTNHFVVCPVGKRP